jgi:hypothetical protein
MHMPHMTRCMAPLAGQALALHVRRTGGVVTARRRRRRRREAWGCHCGYVATAVKCTVHTLCLYGDTVHLAWGCHCEHSTTDVSRSLAGSEAAVLCVSHPLSRHPHTHCLCRAAAGRRLCLPAEAAASALSLPPNPLARSPALSHARSAAAAAAAAAGGFDGDGGAPTPAVRVGRLVGRGRLGRAFIWGLIQNVWCMGEEVGMDFHTHPHRRC